MSKQNILGNECPEPQLPKSSALCNIRQDSLEYSFSGPDGWIPYGKMCMLLLLDWSTCFDTTNLLGATDSLTGPGWAGCTALSWLCLLLLDKWQRPSLVGYVVFKPLCFATYLWDPSLRAHMHSYLSAFAEAASIIAQVCQCLWEIITWLKRIRMQLFVDKTMWGWQGKAIPQELNFCWGLFPMGCQCDAQNQVQLGVPSVMST